MIRILYGALLIWQIVWLVMAFRRKGGWLRLLILEIASMVLAFGCMWYFDTLPGYGIMPGWAYFVEVFYSLVAGGVYFVMTLVTGLAALLRKK